MAHEHSGACRLGTSQVKAFTTAAAIDNVISAGVHRVRVVVTAAAHIKIGVDPTATTSDVYMPANVPEIFICAPGEKVSAVQVSSGGNLHVTEVD